MIDLVEIRTASTARRIMIEFACPHCSRKMTAGDEAAGRRGKCKSCGNKITVPGSGAETAFSPPDFLEPARPAPLPVSLTSIVVDPPPTPVAVQVNFQQPSKASHSRGIASVILGVLAFLICWIPLVGLLGLPLSGLGFLLGLGGIFLAARRKGSGLGFPIAGSAICALAMFATVSLTIVFGKVMSATGEAIEQANKRTNAANQIVVIPKPKPSNQAANTVAEKKKPTPRKEESEPVDEWAHAGNAV
jgi:DNA-directed RNA polymerase subunit RPC12/RpoP